MSDLDTEILTKAMKTAYAHGWRPLKGANFNNCQVHQWQDEKMVGVAVLFPNRDMAVSWVRELEGIIYNHAFAKALWGEEIQYHDYNDMFAWQYNLQQMVIAVDPVKYLGEHI